MPFHRLYVASSEGGYDHTGRDTYVWGQQGNGTWQLRVRFDSPAMAAAKAPALDASGDIKPTGKH